jgi:hypothetical protein
MLCKHQIAFEVWNNSYERLLKCRGNNKNQPLIPALILFVNKYARHFANRKVNKHSLYIALELQIVKKNNI